MKRTNKELNRMIDDLTAEVRREVIDPAVVDGAAERVWTRLNGERAGAQAGVTPADQIRSCADFQTLIPAYLQGSLSPARTMLLEDHTLECIPCRKALKAARVGSGAAAQEQQVRPAKTHRISPTVLRWGIAAVFVIGFSLVLVPWLQRFFYSFGTLHAIVQAANGPVYRVADAKNQVIAAGEELQKGEKIRTAKEAGAVVRLADGSLIEMKERSEFSVTENSEGTTIHLDRGHIIVQAAKQRSRHLYVATSDSLVSVTGTIFSVNSGTKGSRVSVVEGEVHVDHAGEKHVLHPLDQVSTAESLDRVPVREEIAWSRNADQYKRLLAEAAKVRQEIDQQVARPGVRYSTRLLDLVPEGTVLYVAIPNLSATLGEANRLLQERIQQNPTLREWYEKEEASSKGRPGVSRVIEQVREFGEYLGAEIVVSAAMDERGEPGDPLVLTELSNASGFRSYLEGQLEKLKAEGKKGPAVRIVDDPLTAVAQSEGGKSHDEIFVWINGDLLAASPKLVTLGRLATSLKTPGSNHFSQTAFYARLAEIYREGAGLIVAADLEQIIAHGLGGNRQSSEDTRQTQALQQLGVFDLKHFIVELKESQGKAQNRAVLTFNETHRGMTSWLAAPGPMGALEFISPDANVAAAFVVKQPVALVDDLFNFLKTVDPTGWQRFKDEEAAHGVDIRNDIAAPLGGEFAFALDGPLLPIPSWKLVVEVYDQAHLQQSLERLAQKLSEWAASEGKAGFKLEQADVSGRTFYTLKSLDFPVEMDYTYANGYLVAAPSRALVDRAIKYRESGYTLLRSPRFTAALPEDGQANFSALLYQNLAPLVESVARTMGGAKKGASNEQQMLKSLASSAPALAYVYAQGDRITLSANSEGGPIGLSPSSLLGLPGSFGLQQILRGGER